MQLTDLPLNELEPQFHEFVRGKKCAIVGPAPQILNDFQGEMLETCYDLIIRFNRALVAWDSSKEVHLGRRCDILYHCRVKNWDCGGPYDKEAYAARGLQWIANQHTGGGGVAAEKWHRDWAISNGFKFHHFDLEFFDPFSYLIRSRPNAAAGAIVDLLRYGASEVYVTGVTMMRGGYDRKYKDMGEKEAIAENERFKCHNIKAQTKLLQFIWGMDPRFKPDKYLQEVLLNEPKDSSTY